MYSVLHLRINGKREHANLVAFFIKRYNLDFLWPAHDIPQFPLCAIVNSPPNPDPGITRTVLQRARQLRTDNRGPETNFVQCEKKQCPVFSAFFYRTHPGFIECLIYWSPDKR